jgi:deoxyribose-phosphate aldolase
VDEVDVVVNLCAIKEKNWSFVQNDIYTMTTAVHLKGKKIKVILETALLDREEIIKLCEICNQSKPDFVKLLLERTEEELRLKSYDCSENSLTLAYN